MPTSVPSGRTAAATRAAVALGALAALAGGCSDQGLANAEPEIALSVTQIDFGAVNLGTPSSVTVVVENVGTGTLEVTSVELTPETDARVFEHTLPPERISVGSPGSFQVTFIPDEEVAFSGTLRVRSDAVEASVIDVPLLGTGAVPDLSVSPTSLSFEPGDDTESFTLSSEGSGTVLVQSIDLFDDDQVFAATPAAGHDPPFELTPGESVDVTVTYTGPSEGGAYSGEVWITSNDVQSPQLRVSLSASGGGGSGGEPPEVRIVAPTSGSVVHEGLPITFTGEVSDAEEPAEHLVVTWRSSANDPPVLFTGFPEADGTVSFTLDDLDPGSHTIELTAQDNDGNQSSASVQLLIWRDGDVFDYVISGEAGSIYTYFGVDDDIELWLTSGEGTTLIYQDATGELDSLAPIHFEASPGDTLRVVATDVHAWMKRLDPLYLNLVGANAATGSQVLNATPIWVSGYRELETDMPSCDDLDSPSWAGYEGVCYDPAYGYASWPNVFFDESIVIEIPS